MDIGIIFPQTEIETGKDAIIKFAKTAENLGFSHIFMADHVLGANPAVHEHVRDHYYTHDSIINEVFVTLGFISAITEKIGLMTGILILPQRSAALVAKQSAEIAVLSNDRFRLGIGVGWNHVEFEALGMDFENRGPFVTEQIQLIRELWSKDIVDFHGQWHDVSQAGLNPRPNRKLPLWLGAGSSFFPKPPKVVLQRVAEYADGWCPNFEPDDQGREIVDTVTRMMEANHRDPSTLLLEGRIRTSGKTPDEIKKEIEQWRELGASHIGIENRRAGIKGIQSHLEAMNDFVTQVGFS